MPQPSRIGAEDARRASAWRGQRPSGVVSGGPLLAVPTAALRVLPWVAAATQREGTGQDTTGHDRTGELCPGTFGVRIVRTERAGQTEPAGGAAAAPGESPPAGTE